MLRKLGILAGAVAGSLCALGLVLAISRCHGSVAPTPPSLGAAVSEAEGPLAEVWLQYTQDSEALVGTAQADFLAALDADSQVRVTVADAAEAIAFKDFLRRRDLAGRLQNRLTVVISQGPLTPWTRDRALALAAPGTDLTLLVPPPPDAAWQRRRNDWTASWTVGRLRGRTRIVQLPLDFDGGDLVLLADQVLFDANLLAKNSGNGFLTLPELAKALQTWTGRPALALGAVDGDVPRYHMAMYMMPIGNRTALVGDPSLGRALTGPAWQPGDDSVESEERLIADDTPATQARFDRAARDLQVNGWRVLRVPVVAFDDRTYITYTNAVLETRGERRRVYLPVYAGPGVESAAARLDDAAAKVWRDAGFEVRPVRVAGVWRHHGTIGCLVNVLRRG